MITLTWTECIDIIMSRIDDFESIGDWENFDIEDFMRSQGACGVDITTMKRHYDQFVEEMKNEFRENDLPDDLFVIG